MDALVAERPESPIAAAVPPAELRARWVDPGPRNSEPPPHAGLEPTPLAQSARDALRELVMRHLPAPTNLKASAVVPAAARFAGPAGRATLNATARVLVHQVGAQVLRAVELQADPLVALILATGPGDDEGALHWALVPGGPSVTARADALQLLRAMRSPGAFVIAAAAGQFRVGPLGVGGEVPAWDEVEWRLFEDLAALEEWTGEEIPVPDELDNDTATRVAQAATWVRTQRIRARVGGRVTFRARGVADPSTADELRVFDNQVLSLGDRTLNLGQTILRIPIRVIEAGSVEPDGTIPVVAETPPGEVELTLMQPTTRRLPPRRTQTLAEAPPSRSADDRSPTLAELGLEPVALARTPLRERAGVVSGGPLTTADSVDALLDAIRGA